MSYTLPIELPNGPEVAVPAASGPVVLYDQPLPTNIQPGESWSINRVAAQFRCKHFEKEHEQSETKNESTVKYKTGEEAEDALYSGLEYEEEITPASLNSPYEKKYTSRGGYFDGEIRSPHNWGPSRNVRFSPAPDRCSLSS